MGHTAVDVNIYAYGLKSDLLRGNLENTDISDFIVNFLKLDLNDITKRLNGYICDIAIMNTVVILTLLFQQRCQISLKVSECYRGIIFERLQSL